MSVSSSFTQSVSGSFVTKERWEAKVIYNKKIKQEKDELVKKFLGVKRDIEDSIHEFGENI